ncbi:unnamed protein product [Bursaphelenchus okinawaensis]|uniref:Uncharacterized protein n=1 Tax=Bursaphelenchus okinawaensis TaxID=465554 RepID=A0A811K0Z4_9BILA|nr:unnamed protein product [Bursaphelenchus okinawaensis]CAG9089584.1 unnamed protein product [Bursaphelenchus okinawaensis]
MFTSLSNADLHTVYGTRTRNSSLRTAAANLNYGSETYQCNYCDIKQCTKKKTTGKSFGEVFCYSKQYVDEDPEDAPTTTCITDEAELRYLVLAERLKDSNTCQTAKEDPNIRICWCKASVKRSMSRVEQLQERSRLRFATGAKGGVKLVHYQSANQRQINQNYDNTIRSPQTLRQGPRVQASGLQRIGSTVTPSGQDFHSRHKIAATHGGIASRLTNPRRPSSTLTDGSSQVLVSNIVILTSVAVLFIHQLFL